MKNFKLIATVSIFLFTLTNHSNKISHKKVEPFLNQVNIENNQSVHEVTELNKSLEVELNTYARLQQKLNTLKQ